MLDTSFQAVSLADIHVLPGFNPRRFFDDSKLASLAESIRAQGVIQPITLRPHPTDVGYALVAGERRFRAAKLAGLDRIPAVIRDYDDSQALAVASIENQERESISVAEEANIGRRALDATNGDKAEACRLLGWSATKLDMRLMLLNAEPFVLDAIASKKLKLGHGELLSTLTPELQRSVFDKVIAHNVTVEVLRDQLAAFTQDLRSAPFNTAGCKGCPHNSASQSSLFEFHVGDGRCSNRPCWDGKVEVFLTERKSELATEVNVVFFDREKDPATYVTLHELGPSGVGTEQFESGCKGCAQFGAIIGTAPGRQGVVSRPICFSRGCNSGKVAEYQASLPEPEASNDAQPSATPKKASKPDPKAKAKKGGKAVVQAVGSPKKVVEHVHKELRRLAAEHAATDAHVQRALSVYALRQLTHDDSHSTPAKGVSVLLAMSDAELDADRTRLVTKVLHTHTGRYGSDELGATGFTSVAAQSLQSVAFNLAGALPISREFLDAHTKSGLEALLASADFYRSLEGQDEAAKQKAFKKLMSGKNAEIIEAVLAVPHDYSQFIPAVVTESFDKLTEIK